MTASQIRPSPATVCPLVSGRPAWLVVLALVGLPMATDAVAADRSVLEHEPHVLDPTGLCGGTVVDPFLANPHGQGAGRRLVRLPDGDYVVAALVPEHGFNPPSNGMWNIGLVRYRLPCSHVPWLPGQYSVPTSGTWPRRYLVYPNVGQPQFTAISDLKVFGPHIHVLADRRKTTSNSSVRDVVVVVFTQDGDFVGQYDAMNSALDERGSGMVFFQDQGFPPGPAKLFVTGNTTGLAQVPGGTTITLVRLTRAAGGGLTRDGTLGAGGNLTYMDYVLPDSYCAAAAQPCHGFVNGIALSQSGGIFNRLYLGGALRRNTSGNWDYLVLATGFNGVLDTSFGGSGGGRQWAIFDAGGTNRDVANAVLVRQVAPFQDEVFLVGEVAQQPAADGNAGNRGIGVAKFTHAGFLDPGFGSGGRSVTGGCSTPPCQDFFNGGDAESYPRAAVLGGSRLYIAGRERRRPQCVDLCTLPHETSAELLVVDAGSGARRHQSTPVPAADFHDLLREPDGRLSVAGVYVENALPRVLTAHFRADRLFGNGFQAP